MFKISIQADEIEKMPLGSFPGKIHVIDKPGLEYAKAIADEARCSTSSLSFKSDVFKLTDIRPGIITTSPSCSCPVLTRLSFSELTSSVCAN